MSGYNCSIENEICCISLNSNIAGTSTLMDKLYKLNRKASCNNEKLYSSNFDTNHKLINENYQCYGISDWVIFLNKKFQGL